MDGKGKSEAPVRQGVRAEKGSSARGSEKRLIRERRVRTGRRSETGKSNRPEKKERRSRIWSKRGRHAIAKKELQRLKSSASCPFSMGKT